MANFLKAKSKRVVLWYIIELTNFIGEKKKKKFIWSVQHSSNRLKEIIKTTNPLASLSASVNIQVWRYLGWKRGELFLTECWDAIKITGVLRCSGWRETKKHSTYYEWRAENQLLFERAIAGNLWTKIVSCVRQTVCNMLFFLKGLSQLFLRCGCKLFLRIDKIHLTPRGVHRSKSRKKNAFFLVRYEQRKRARGVSLCANPNSIKRAWRW